MPKRAKELSAVEVKRIEHPGKGRNVTVAVGGVAGLMLQVTPTDAKSWLLRYTFDQKRRELGLGPYPDVTLAQARERAREARDKLYRGVDPVAEKDAAKAAQRDRMTFAKAVEKYLEGKGAEFGNAKHKEQWKSTLTQYAVGVIGHMSVADITVQDVQRVLMQDTVDRKGNPQGAFWLAKTETASRLRGRVENVLAWATVHGHRKGDNPARWTGNLDAILPKPGRLMKGDNQPALALGDVSRWFADLRTREGTGARALEFLAMTAARSGEVRGATWDEFDLVAKIWTIPAARMKAGKEHRVPLTDDAVALLEGLVKIKDVSLVFPAVKGGQLSDMTISAVMRRMQEDQTAKGEAGYLDPRNKRPAVPHGLRSTFRDWAAERTEYPREVAELALAHNVGSEVERAYRRADMVERRRSMMAAWGRFLRGEDAPKVVKLEARG